MYAVVRNDTSLQIKCLGIPVRSQDSVWRNQEGDICASIEIRVGAILRGLWHVDLYDIEGDTPVQPNQTTVE